MRIGRRPRVPVAAMTVPAGSARAAPWAPLRRPPSPPIDIYRRLIIVPIGNDGVAFPVTFSGAGQAQAFCGPTGIGASWQPDQAAIYTSVGPLDAAQAVIFVGPLPVPQYQVASSLAGGGAQLALGGVELAPGWFIWAQWTGGTPGAVAFLNVTGRKTVLTA